MFIKIKTSIRPLILKRKFKIWAYYHLLLTGLLLSMFSAMAADDTLKAFQASYDLFKNEKLVGEAILQVEKSDNRLRWHMTTKPGGLYALITNKQPYSESILIRTKGDYRLSSVKNSTSMRDSPQEVANFDWQQSLLTATRKNKQVKRRLSRDVYDYLSIHWLAAQMSLADADQYELIFYRAGKLIKSTLTRTGTESLTIGNNTVPATVFEQNLEGSSRRFTYHYGQENLWLPLRIERNRKGRKATVMLLKSLEGNL